MKILTLSRAIVFLTATVFFSHSLVAEIYKYQDENGRWHFTDKKPVDKKSSTVEVRASKKTSNGAGDRSKWVDLYGRLTSQYKTGSQIELATLSVVKIETILGLGSGFFVSDDGYIVTNRHVIRPDKSDSWKKEEQALEEEDKRFKEIFRELKQEKGRLNLLKEDLNSYKHQVKYPEQYDKPISKKAYNYYKQRYSKDYKDYKLRSKRANREYEAFKKRKVTKSRQGLNAAVARTFKVVFKDNTTARAQLVKISKSEDLALLKVNEYITPYLEPASKLPSQAERIYAIGSPLGQSDSVTSGVITKVDDSEIITDATILPGNSGGPMLNEKGKLLGVNTLKKMAGEQDGAEGFGIAIPVSKVFREFKDFFPKKEGES